MNKFYKKWFFPLAAPSIILFILVVGIPFITGVVYSFTSWRGTYFSGGSFFGSFVGFDNYVKSFTNENFLSSLVNSVEFTAIMLVTVLVFSLLFALMVSSIKKGAGLYRSAFFLPNLLGGLALGYIWSFVFEIIFSQILFNPEGLVNVPILTNMLQNHHKAIFAMAIVATWQMAGYMMIIFVTGLNNIPGDLYEAADIDGCNAFQRFKTITLPMLMPSFTIVIFMTLANCFKMLDINVALTDGNFNTRLLAYQILRITRDYSPPDYGQAQAQAVIFFVIIATVTLLQVSITKKKEVEM
ncbi:MAG: sugar ABC transporter permease [Bacillota bacterium]|nr:sugar ABC transporter permease [Bacillota bacterium]